MRFSALACTMTLDWVMSISEAVTNFLNPSESYVAT